MSQRQIVTLTLNPALDVSCGVDRVAPEIKLRCSSPVMEPGGGGINVSRAIKHLGGESIAIWTKGGPTGDLFQLLLSAEISNSVPVEINGLTRDSIVVDEATSGQQYRFCMPGPELSRLEIEDVLHTLSDLETEPDFFVISGSRPPGIDHDFYQQAIAKLPASCRVVVDVGGEFLGSKSPASVYLVKPNLKELGDFVGREVTSDAEIESASREIIGNGISSVVVTSLGAGGAFVVGEELVEHIRSPTVPIRSKVGAGDSMVAGITLALAREMPLEQAIRFGVAAGAAAVMTPGTGLCRKEDTEALFDQM